jgi:hypothetical protein
MLQSLASPFQRSRAERPSGAYMQGPNRSSATAALRKRKAPAAEPVATSPKQQRDELRDALQLAMNERRYGDALNHILGLVALDPNDPRWPHKYGDVLRSLRRNNEAAAAYRRAARRYEAAGFPVRATAMMRLSFELEGDNGPRASEPEQSGRRMISGTVDVTVPITAEEAKLKVG